MGFLSNIFGSGTSNEELATIVNEGEAFLVDVRSPGEFAAGSAKGAVNIPLDLVTQRAKEFDGKKHIVVFCRSGSRSGQAKQILERLGYKNVINGGTLHDVASLQK